MLRIVWINVYDKISGSKIIFLVLYVNNTLLETSDMRGLHVVKQFLSKKFDIKHLGEASLTTGNKINRDRAQGSEVLSWETICQ